MVDSWPKPVDLKNIVTWLIIELYETWVCSSPFFIWVLANPEGRAGSLGLSLHIH